MHRGAARRARRSTDRKPRHSRLKYTVFKRGSKELWVYVKKIMRDCGLQEYMLRRDERANHGFDP